MADLTARHERSPVKEDFVCELVWIATALQHRFNIGIQGQRLNVNNIRCLALPCDGPVVKEGTGNPRTEGLHFDRYGAVLRYGNGVGTLKCSDRICNRNTALKSFCRSIAPPSNACGDGHRTLGYAGYLSALVHACNRAIRRLPCNPARRPWWPVRFECVQACTWNIDEGHLEFPADAHSAFVRQ